MSDLKADGIVMWQKKYYGYISTFMCFILPSKKLYLFSPLFLADSRCPYLPILLVIHVHIRMDSKCHMVHKFYLSHVWIKTMEQEHLTSR